ncbi:hypothetical protein CBR_g3299 [Chara braunii]|uniref:1,4-alpha-glucan branching enzyme n=1 Tax=Chara braunii TaxID=69332 RepID=A0A388KFD4_CHABU|nr:hypothetical protein CBR_g3299 [Chara braunii]|eukprot:GBG68759.1 hypothetical protein CBR_g3299 [Chara braunii]
MFSGVSISINWKGVSAVMHPLLSSGISLGSSSSSSSTSPSSPSSSYSLTSSTSAFSPSSLLSPSIRGGAVMDGDGSPPGPESLSGVLGRRPGSLRRISVGGGGGGGGGGGSTTSSPSSSSRDDGRSTDYMARGVRRCISFSGFGEAWSASRSHGWVGPRWWNNVHANQENLGGPPNEQWVHPPRQGVGMPRIRSFPTTPSALERPVSWEDMDYSSNGLDVIATDPALAAHQKHLMSRYRLFLSTKKMYDAHEGGLEEFARGYEKFGFNREDGGIVYKEWAPAARAAQLIGDFNNWDGSSHYMEKKEFGVWSIHIPDRNGRSAIPHGSRVKIRLQKADGSWVDRISAWIKYALQERGKLEGTYDGIYWDPPKNERYKFKYRRPPRPAAPRIYEAHVGMSSPECKVATYRYFADTVLPRIKANGYNTIQLMAVMEHAYYASFGYHVTNFFAVSSRSGTPEDLKYLIDKAHKLGLRILMDIVHSHASKNEKDGLNGFDFGQSSRDSYFHTGERGYHRLWDSRLFNYNNWEVQRFLLSNLRWWMEEYGFDGFRFDGVTSMLYHHHGINRSFTGDYREYFDWTTDEEAAVYLMLANDLIHHLYDEATTIAEDVSGMPTIGLPVQVGGIGFDYRLAMGIPDKWIYLMKNKRDEHWSMQEIVKALTNRRYTEKVVAYAESHDQSMVGDKSFAFMLMDKEMYSGMSDLAPASPAVDRGIALHKMIHLISMALGGDGYLNFMGNEYMYRFDQAMNELEERYHFLSSQLQVVSSANEKEKVIVFERGELVFVFNFHPSCTYSDYKVGCERPGRYRIALDSDAREMGGKGRLIMLLLAVIAVVILVLVVEEHFVIAFLRIWVVFVGEAAFVVPALIVVIALVCVTGHDEFLMITLIGALVLPALIVVHADIGTCLPPLNAPNGIGGQVYFRHPEAEDLKREEEGRLWQRWRGYSDASGHSLENGGTDSTMGEDDDSDDGDYFSEGYEAQYVYGQHIRSHSYEAQNVFGQHMRSHSSEAEDVYGQHIRSRSYEVQNVYGQHQQQQQCQQQQQQQEQEQEEQEEDDFVMSTAWDYMPSAAEGCDQLSGERSEQELVAMMDKVEIEERGEMEGMEGEMEGGMEGGVEGEEGMVCEEQGQDLPRSVEESPKGYWRYGDEESNWDEEGGEVVGFVYPWVP